MSDKALVIVDVQKCFCPGGELAVEEGDKVVPVINQYTERFERLGLPIYATRDWHPQMTKHFIEYGGLWPPHCVQNTPSAEFHPDLKLPNDVEIISVGIRPDEEGYSAFEGINEDGESFEGTLRERGVLHLYIGGIATDYCVKETILDATRRGFKATLLVDAVKGVNLQPEDSEQAIEQMKSAGADVKRLEEVDNELTAGVHS